MPTLRQKTTQAILWNTLDIFLKHGLQFVVVVALARILSPDDFGIIAILALFTSIANIFIDSGFSAALIQRQNTTHSEESTVFYFNLAIGVFAALLLCALGPWIAGTFKQPVLESLTYVMAFNLVVNALGSIHTTLLTKVLNFKKLAKVSGISSLISSALALFLALKGYGIWSLAAQTLTSSLISVALLWLWHPWRPAWTFCFESLRSLFRFGGYLMVASIIDALDTNLYSILIGKYYSVRDVGFYERAQKTQQLPVNLIMLISSRVAFSVFSSVAEDKEKLARCFRKAQRLIMYINIPLLTSMIVLADPIVITLFGEAWLMSIPILQVLGIAGIMWPMHMLNINVLKAQGRSDLNFKLVLIKKSVAIALTIGGSFYGVMAIAWAQVASSVFSIVVNTYYSWLFLKYGLFKQIRDLFPCSAAAVLAGLGMWLLVNSQELPHDIELVLALFIGAVLYLMVSLLFHINALSEIIELVFHSKEFKTQPGVE